MNKHGRKKQLDHSELSKELLNYSCNHVNMDNEERKNFVRELNTVSMYSACTAGENNFGIFGQNIVVNVFLSQFQCNFRML